MTALASILVLALSSCAGLDLTLPSTSPTPAPAVQPTQFESHVAAQLGRALGSVSEEEVAQAQSAVEQNPDDARAWFILCGAQATAGSWVDAEAACRRSAELDPQAADVHATLAALYLDVYRTRDAFESSSRALEITPLSVQALAYKGISALALGRNEEAIPALTKALELEPNRLDLYPRLAKAQSEKGDLASTLITLRAGLALDPNHADLKYLLDSTVATVDTRLKDVREQLRLNPNDPEAHATAGSIYSRMGFLEEARAEFDAALASLETHSDPKVHAARQSTLHYNKGVVYRLEGDVDAALIEFGTALGLSGSRAAEIHYNMGVLRLENGDTEGAIHEFRLSIDLNPNVAENRQALIGALEKAGRFPEAEVERAALAEL